MSPLNNADMAMENEEVEKANAEIEQAMSALSAFSYMDIDDDDYFDGTFIPGEVKPSPLSEAEVLEKIRLLNAELNDGQRQAAETTEGPVIIIAGAGAGKTKTLTHRVSTLLLKGAHAANIMVVTFTNKAAEEIRDRIEMMVGEDAQYISAGTFHSIVFRKILKRFPESNYLASINLDMVECAILDDADATKLLKESMSELSEDDIQEIEANDWKLSKFEKIMGKARANGLDVRDFMTSIIPGALDEVAARITVRIWNAYNEKCRAANGIDFDDILLFCNKMLKSEPHIAEYLGDEFKYVMLDEYQDTNRVQMDIMDCIAKKHQNICVVGDEKQSIYGFREADIEVILSFRRRYPQAAQINATQNYRSYPEIIRYANACAAAMDQRLSDGQLVPMRQCDESPAELVQKKGNKVFMVEFDDSLTEADNVAKAIHRDLRNGVDPKEIAVLYRNRSLKIDLERKLVDMNVPYRLVGDTAFFQKAEVKDMVAMIKFIFNPWDTMAGMRMLNALKVGVSTQAAKKAAADGLNVNEFLKSQATKRLKVKKKGEDEPSLTAAAQKIAPFMTICEQLRESVKYGDSPAFIKETIAQIWDIYMRPRMALSAKKSERNDALDERLNNVAYVLQRIEGAMEKGTGMDAIIEDLSMMVENNPDMDKQIHTKVLLMTFHGSKGLEFDNVYMIGVDNVCMPGPDAEYKDIEESRRLMYVGMTRPKKKLAISYSRQRLEHGQMIQPMASPFIEEIERALKVKRFVVQPSEKQPSKSYSQ